MACKFLMMLFLVTIWCCLFACQILRMTAHQFISSKVVFWLLFAGKICPVLDIREATPNTTDVEYETVVEFTCNVGYILAHNHVAEDMITTCLHTAQWNKQVPDCRGMIIS